MLFLLQMLQCLLVRVRNCSIHNQCSSCLQDIFSLVNLHLRRRLYLCNISKQIGPRHPSHTHSQPTVPHLSSHMPSLAVSAATSHSSYTFQPPYSQQQDNVNAMAQYQPSGQMHAPPAGQPWVSSVSQSAATVTPVQQAGVQSSGTPSTDSATSAPNQQSASDWQEHTAADDRRYYYNKRTRQSSWEKPLELMSPIERADASTVWKEFTSSDGRKYYYNKVTQQSTWSIPEELKLATWLVNWR
ncbi:hypothetical protein HN51_022555 [Arachis hypogaea]